MCPAPSRAPQSPLQPSRQAVGSRDMWEQRHVIGQACVSCSRSREQPRQASRAAAAAAAAPLTDLCPPRPPRSCALRGCPAASWSAPQTRGWAPGGEQGGGQARIRGDEVAMSQVGGQQVSKVGGCQTCRQADASVRRQATWAPSPGHTAPSQTPPRHAPTRQPPTHPSTLPTGTHPP